MSIVSAVVKARPMHGSKFKPSCGSNDINAASMVFNKNSSTMIPSSPYFNTIDRVRTQEFKTKFVEFVKNNGNCTRPNVTSITTNKILHVSQRFVKLRENSNICTYQEAGWLLARDFDTKLQMAPKSQSK